MVEYEYIEFKILELEIQRNVIKYLGMMKYYLKPVFT